MDKMINWQGFEQEIKNRRDFIEKSWNIDILKARSGIYSNTFENRKLGRVGRKYGNKKEENKKYKFNPIIFKSNNEIEKYFDQYNDDLNNLSIEQIKALESYRDMFGVDINNYLRSGVLFKLFSPTTVNTIKNNINLIKLSFSKIKAKDDLILHRKIYGSNKEFNKRLFGLNIGDEFEENGFISTSLDSNVEIKNQIPAINIVISIKKGQNIVPMHNIGDDEVKKSFKDEFEILLPPSKFKVVGKINNYIKLEII